MTDFEGKTILSTFALSKTFSNGTSKVEALQDIQFDVDRNSFVCIVGPSGCGKSTLLRLLAGLSQATRGEVVFEGKPLLQPRRRIGFVFQDANLMPWRSALENITLPLELMGIPWGERVAKAQDLLALVGLSGFENSLPRDLSGGMAQRVAIARALIHDPDLLLLDEPFGSLDAMTRERMADELLRIWTAHRVTVVMVTHSIPEAVLLADRVLVLCSRPGRIRQEITIPLDRPRKIEMSYSLEFGQLVQSIRSEIG
jgi:NitT/TauT family transport system ATP-binding protein